MDVDSNGNWSWKNFLGWLAVAVLAVVAIAAVVVGTVITGGALGATFVGAGSGALFGIGSSIISQGGFKNANPWQVAFNGVIGAATGATMASPLVWGASGAIVSGLSFVQSVGNDLFDNGGNWSKINWGKATVIGLVNGLVAGGGKYIATSSKFMNQFANNSKVVQQAATRCNFFANTVLSRMAYQEFWTIMLKQQALFTKGIILIANILRGGTSLGINKAW